MTSSHGMDGEGRVTMEVPPGVDEAFLAQLQRYEAALTAAGRPAAEVLMPGIDPDRVRQRLAEIGMEPSTELLTWWFWHNGLVYGAWDTLPRWRPASLDQAISLRQTNLDLFPKGPFADDPEWGSWRPTWLPIAVPESMYQLAADCTPPQTRGCRIAVVGPDSGLFDDPRLAKEALSLSDAVAMWTRTLEEGWYTYTPNQQRAWTQTRTSREFAEAFRLNALV